MRKSKTPITPTELWQADAKDFQRWFRKQKYSFGATPNWTQIAEMERTWCAARKSLREAK